MVGRHAEVGSGLESVATSWETCAQAPEEDCADGFGWALVQTLCRPTTCARESASRTGASTNAEECAVDANLARARYVSMRRRRRGRCRVGSRLQVVAERK